MNKAEGRELRAEVGALLHPDAGCRREADRRLKSHSQGDRELEEEAAEQRKATPEGQRSRLRSQVREEERETLCIGQRGIAVQLDISLGGGAGEVKLDAAGEAEAGLGGNTCKLSCSGGSEKDRT